MWFYQKQPFVVDAMLFVEIKFFKIYNGSMLTYFIAAAAFALIIFLLNFYIKFKSLENKNSEIKARKMHRKKDFWFRVRFAVLLFCRVKIWSAEFIDL